MPRDDAENEQARQRERELASARLTLAELEQQIRSAHDLDAERRQRVLDEIGELRALLDPASAARSPRGSDRLEQLALEFEVSHPSAAELLGRLANLLSSMGI
jgi:hypothetical protein